MRFKKIVEKPLLTVLYFFQYTDKRTENSDLVRKRYSFLYAQSKMKKIQLKMYCNILFDPQTVKDTNELSNASRTQKVTR